jgi:hypothetical protein
MRVDVPQSCASAGTEESPQNSTDNTARPKVVFTRFLKLCLPIVILLDVIKIGVIAVLLPFRRRTAGIGFAGLNIFYVFARHTAQQLSDPQYLD